MLRQLKITAVLYIDHNMNWQRQIGSERWHDYICYECEKLKECFADKGIPVFVGETTSDYDVNIVDDSVYGGEQGCIRELIKIARQEYGFIPVFWDTNNADGSSFYSRYQCKISDEKNAETVKMYG